MTEQDEWTVLVSPLASWPGEIRLPRPDDFSGVHWATWKAAVEKPLRKHYAEIHKFAYAALELIKAHGEWMLDIPLETVQAWETKPEDERIRLVSWLGQVSLTYIATITNPKE
jgi:hypothetical protein